MDKKTWLASGVLVYHEGIGRVEVSGLCRSFKFHHTKRHKHCLYGTGFVYRSIVMERTKGLLPNHCYTRLEMHNPPHVFVCCSINGNLYWKYLNSIVWSGVHVILLLL